MPVLGILIGVSRGYQPTSVNDYALLIRTIIKKKQRLNQCSGLMSNHQTLKL